MNRAALILAALAMTLSAACDAGAAPKQGRDCLLPNADTTLHGIGLGDFKSTQKVLGTDRRGAPHEPNTDFPWYAFVSRDGRETMSLRHHAGDVSDSYMEFEVRYGRNAKGVPLNDDRFVSGKGVKLGMARKAVVTLFGPCFTATRNGAIETLRYEIADDSDKPRAPVLRAANMPQYYAEYEFENGRLVRFAFGHDPV